jgi:hypothetical protein
MNLDFEVVFRNINVFGGHSPWINSDRDRIMQVLLGL